MYMLDIEKYDKNLVVETTITEPDLVWFNVRDLPFQIYGVMYDTEKECYTRMPQKEAAAVSPSVGGSLNRCTAGGRVRFHTDSGYIGIRAVMSPGRNMAHMTLAGQSGFDLYRTLPGEEELFCRTFMPIRDMTEGYSAGHSLLRTEADYTIHFPLYDGVKELYIALKKGAKLGAATPYRDVPPVVYYGSSITQGGCASRPGNAYQSIITRKTRVDHINLGFSGSARGEQAMAAYIAKLNMSAFVLDYDHNADTVADLAATHAAFYQTVRDANQDLPIVIVSAPTILMKPTPYRERREVIRKTYEDAVAAGDRNVYFVDGAEIFAGDCWDSCTVDGTHPNDLGFYRMATHIGAVVSEILSRV